MGTETSRGVYFVFTPDTTGAFYRLSFLGLSSTADRLAWSGEVPRVIRHTPRLLHLSAGQLRALHAATSI